jgi:hypothetical protein
MILGDAAGSVANAELTVHDARVQRSSTGTLLHTNHYIDPELAGSDTYVPESSCHRYDRITELVNATARRWHHL